MERTFVWEPADILPGKDRALRRMGITDPGEVHNRTEETLDHANRFFCQLARPVVKIRDISLKEFAIVYRGEGLNADDTPVCDVVARADFLALFAVTLGDIVSATITDFFDCNEPHLGFVLDAVCSEAAETTADRLEAIFLETVRRNIHKVPKEISGPVMSRRYSPGYCGWHLSAQVKLLDFLKA
ncbi:MAG: hypothetical protein U9P14_10265, partial [Gemmatimonadota bacterium]|nr:hypothetical protein [Gemmatimonadota bacterium]